MDDMFHLNIDPGMEERDLERPARDIAMRATGILFIGAAVAVALLMVAGAAWVLKAVL